MLTLSYVSCGCRESANLISNLISELEKSTEKIDGAAAANMDLYRVIHCSSSANAYERGISYNGIFSLMTVQN